MSTKQTTGADKNPIGSSVDEDFKVPSCTIEDVDKALFNLFEKELNLQYELDGNLEKIPVIFATGERFAILRRRKPLRDKAGAIILPLISISRTSVNQNRSRGASTNQGGDLVVKKRLSPDDSSYQRIVNKENLKNQDDRATPQHKIAEVEGLSTQGHGTLPGTIAKRSGGDIPKLEYRDGRLLTNSIGNNIFEIFTIPLPKYFTATYEITFWTQYTQQMNHMLMAVMSSYHSNPGKCFRIESDKGYYFVAYFGEALNAGNNFDEFSDNERIVRYSFSVDVPGYIINADYPGSTPTHKRYISAPKISFDMVDVLGPVQKQLIEGIPSNDPEDYVLQDLKSMDEPGVSLIVGGKAIPGAPKQSPAPAEKFFENTNVGGQEAGRDHIVVTAKIKDPATGKEVERELPVKMKIPKKGETVYREQFSFSLANLDISAKSDLNIEVV